MCAQHRICMRGKCGVSWNSTRSAAGLVEWGVWRAAAASIINLQLSPVFTATLLTPHTTTSPHPQAATVSNFAHKHTVQSTETLAQLAVKYGTDVPTIKRVNNMTSDHSLQSRAHIFIPGRGIGWVEGVAKGRVQLVMCFQQLLHFPPALGNSFAGIAADQEPVQALCGGTEQAHSLQHNRTRSDAPSPPPPHTHHHAQCGAPPP